MSRSRNGCLAILVGACISASGCGLMPKKALPIDPFEQSILDAQRETNTRLASVTQVESGIKTPVAVAPPSGLPKSFSKKIYLDWYGEVAPVVRAIASSLDWSFIERPMRGAMPLVIVRGDLTIAEALASIGKQTGGRVDIVVDLKAKSLMVQ